jgi:hypothetical protein
MSLEAATLLAVATFALGMAFYYYFLHPKD